jgi:hypothetical protein
MILREPMQIHRVTGEHTYGVLFQVPQPITAEMLDRLIDTFRQKDDGRSTEIGIEFAHLRKGGS